MHTKHYLEESIQDHELLPTSKLILCTSKPLHDSYLRSKHLQLLMHYQIIDPHKKINVFKLRTKFSESSPKLCKNEIMGPTKKS